MNLKQILSKPIPKSEKGVNKVLYASGSLHSKLSILSEIFGVTKSQALNNIVHTFIDNHKDEIEDLIILKKNQLDNLF